ncbi:MAG: hypothetical protein WA960_02245 [Tunicatimonas sp.]
MPSDSRQNFVAKRAAKLSKMDLFLHFIAALRHECYLYASILRDEIHRRTFTFQEMDSLRSSSFYPMLNGVLEG